MADTQTLVIGGGLSGLSTALRLADANIETMLLESNPHLGGRTASWNDNGMHIESGFHRVIGTYREVPKILRMAGTDLDAISIYQDEAELRRADGPSAVYGASLHRAPGRTIKGIIDNNHYLSTTEKLAFSRFFAAGAAHPRQLDQISVQDFALKHGMDQDTITRILEPFTAGVLFLRPDKFSAYVFFRLMISFSPRSITMRLGVYAGGMTDVIANPMGEAIQRKGGNVTSGVTVNRLIVEGGRVIGAETSTGTLKACHTVLATSLAAAQKILRESGLTSGFFEPMLSLPSTAAVAVQLDLEKPALEKDRVTFGPGSALACFAEQSRTTFKQEGGRLSIFLSDADDYLDKEPAWIVNHVVGEAKRLGLNLENQVLDYRVVFHQHDFHCLRPGYNHLRPRQKTDTPGLTLAGDYTRHRFPATMEGAALSARLAAGIAQKAIQ